MNFFIEMIDVGIGDSYIMNFNKENRIVRILVDGGSEKNNLSNIIKAINSMETRNDRNEIGKINGLIVTHIDDDHIGGILKLLNEPEVENYIDFSQECFILFNDLVDPATISYKQGNRLKNTIEKFSNLSLIRTYEENRQFEVNGFKICMRGKNRLEPPPTGKDDDLILIDLLLPFKDTVKKLMKNWLVDKKNSRLVNESSLVCIVKYNDMSVLLASDNYFPTILEELKKIKYESSFDLIMLAHHGAKDNNVNIIDLINQYQCKKIMLPLSKITKKHPDLELIKNILGNRENIQLFCPVELNLEINEYQLQVKHGNLIEVEKERKT